MFDPYPKRTRNLYLTVTSIHQILYVEFYFLSTQSLYYLIRFIKEQKMTETLFEIAPFNKPLFQHSTQSSNSYQIFLQYFTTASYGLYTELFMKKIAANALMKNEGLIKYALKKNFRKCVKKFMLTDLQLIFLAHYCQKNEWSFPCEQVRRDKNILDKIQGEQIDQKCFQLFLDLNAYFIKSYVGNKEQFQAIDNYLLKVFPEFSQIYQKWVINKPIQNFNISPRNINQLYRQFSRGAQVENKKKDFNQLVDNLIDLSTTYSIIPNNRNQRKPKEKHKRDPRSSIYDEQISQKNNLRNSNKNNKQVIDHRRPRRRSQIFKISQDSQILQESQIPKNSHNMNIPSNLISNTSHRPVRKSSILFESLQSLSRKSSQLILTNKLKGEQEVQKEPEPERSRQKKPGNKISLNFKRKQKPNQTVLGFVNQPSGLQIGNNFDEKQQKLLRYDGRSILNQSIKQPNMSFINMRSNRSSRSNSQLPFLWKPSEDNFFEKSKLG